MPHDLFSTLQCKFFSFFTALFKIVTMKIIRLHNYMISNIHKLYKQFLNSNIVSSNWSYLGIDIWFLVFLIPIIGT